MAKEIKLELIEYGADRGSIDAGGFILKLVTEKNYSFQSNVGSYDSMSNRPSVLEEVRRQANEIADDLNVSLTEKLHA